MTGWETRSFPSMTATIWTISVISVWRLPTKCLDQILRVVTVKNCITILNCKLDRFSAELYFKHVLGSMLHPAVHSVWRIVNSLTIVYGEHSLTLMAAQRSVVGSGLVLRWHRLRKLSRSFLFSTILQCVDRSRNQRNFRFGCSFRLVRPMSAVI